ncbi:MAG: crotonase/enoyl-CoA hydratase family protein [Pseudomonadota bacterium]
MNLERHGDVAVITLDDGKANAINPGWMAALISLFDEAEATCKAIVIKGRAGVFSAGFDLKWMGSADSEDLAGLLDAASQMLIRLYGSSRPLVGACTGHAIAAGAFLLCSCDTRIAARGEFLLGANETVNNMRIPVFATEMLRARLGEAALTEALVQARMYDPESALAVGYVDQLADAKQIEGEALALAESLAQLPEDAYAFNKLAARQHTIDTIAAAIGSYAKPRE